LTRATLPVDGETTTIEFDEPTDGYIGLGEEGSLRGGTLHLDLSNRVESRGVKTIAGDQSAVEMQAPVGEPVPIP
jgi:hypothetical protein